MRSSTPEGSDIGDQQAVTSIDHGHTVRQHVVDGRAGARLLDDLAQLLGRRVATHREAHSDLLEAVANGVRQAEDPVEVNVTFDGRLDRLEVDPARRGDVADAGREARGERA
jgi:hypothetical protein